MASYSHVAPCIARSQAVHELLPKCLGVLLKASIEHVDPTAGIRAFSSGSVMQRPASLAGRVCMKCFEMVYNTTSIFTYMPACR